MLLISTTCSLSFTLRDTNHAPETTRLLVFPRARSSPCHLDRSPSPCPLRLPPLSPSFLPNPSRMAAPEACSEPGRSVFEVRHDACTARLSKRQAEKMSGVHQRSTHQYLSFYSSTLPALDSTPNTANIILSLQPVLHPPFCAVMLILRSREPSLLPHGCHC